MLRFIVQSWKNRKERFLLMLIGVLIISAGLSYLVGISQSNKGTVVDELQKEWSASYDIVVRPPDTRSDTERQDLLEPNYLSGIQGGISEDQYETIKDIGDIDVAAPISMIGYMTYTVQFKDMEYDDGIYRMTDSTVTDTGAEERKSEHAYYFEVGSPLKMGKIKDGETIGKEYGLEAAREELGTSFNILLAGIDPEAEAELVGLDKAVVEKGDSRYFNEDDDSRSTIKELQTTGNDIQTTYLPVLASNQEMVDEAYNYTIEKLDLPFSSGDDKRVTLNKLKEEGGTDYLDTVKAKDTTTYTYNSEDGYEKFLEGAFDIGTQEDEVTSDNVGDVFVLREKPTPLSYQKIDSPYEKRWKNAYEVESFDDDNLDENQSYRDIFRPIEYLHLEGNDEDYTMSQRIDPNWVGTYDSGKLDISQDPLSELPMETYRPASADLVLNENEQPVNPPKELKPTQNPFGFLTKPPQMLTTIDGAANILGDEPISAIRINVTGVTDLNEESQNTLESVADEIERKTGLIADITLGSSPQPTLTHVPETDNSEEVGWFEHPWVKLGSSFTIFEETKIGFSVIIASVIGVAVVYVFASNLVSLLARRKEFAVLLAVGWRPRQLSKMIVYESGMLGILASVIAWIILGVVHLTQGTDISLTRILLIGLFGIVIYGLGAVIPAYLARNIQPHEAMKTGEISQSPRRLIQTRGVITMAMNYLFKTFRRSLLSIAAIALPTSLLSFFIFVTFRMKGIMFTTWLGQYTALEIGTGHFIAMGIAFLIAILTTSEIMWQNVAERKPELAVLKSLGWKNRTIRRMIVSEGIVIGVLAGVLGLLITIGMIWAVYQQISFDYIGIVMATGIIPVIAGMIGSLPPAEKSVRVYPSEGINE